MKYKRNIANDDAKESQDYKIWVHTFASSLAIIKKGYVISFNGVKCFIHFYIKNINFIIVIF